MNVSFIRTAASTSSGQLRIHAGDASSVSARRAQTQASRRPAAHLPADPQPLSLRVEDSCNRSILTTHEPGALTQVSLAPGTYRVTTRHGEVERHFTISVGMRECVDMHLN